MCDRAASRNYAVDHSCGAFLIYSRVPDIAREATFRSNLCLWDSLRARSRPEYGLIFGSVTTVVPDPGAGGGRVPGPIPGGSSVPVVAASVGVAPVGSSHIWRAMTDVEGNFAIACRLGPMS
jgi:hypothetical protein